MGLISGGYKKVECCSTLQLTIGLVTCNIGSVPTYNRINARYVVEVTFTRLQTGAAVQNWRVLTDINSENDHRYICYTIVA